MSLLKFLLGAKFSQRKKWRKRKDEETLKLAKVDLSDPQQKRQLMNCIAYSPGIRSDDEARFVDIWANDSLTSEECSTENVVTVVEVHPEHGDETQDELDPEEGNSEQEAEKEEIIFLPENSEQLLDTQEIYQETDKDKDCLEKIEESTDTDTKLKEAPPESAASSCDSDDEDQIVPTSGSSESTGSTSLTPALSIDMETQTDEVPAAVSLRPNHRYSGGHEMRLLSVALSELEAEMAAAKQQPRACSCSAANPKPAPPSPNVAFTLEKNRQIARENANLLSRLQRTQSKIKRQTALPFRPTESSYAINRRKQQEKIERENLIILRKITDARGRAKRRASTERSTAVFSSYC
ncbi:cilia- and flagella-associated protein 97-like [Neocloeon triangulifer]|uniref:cilia- and flagella-associated protein 97-like n=1 Tax=Neocloeon triangulifer TaxID=2078957 RepID=UPI00286EBF58|nr:cilia- and flagella-associated protein 97-like [Neocloeon triangulifer]XP_059487960.1 cilia- and flagella-associated protein 97-like [Neocloeon triangulifer]